MSTIGSLNPVAVAAPAAETAWKAKLTEGAHQFEAMMLEQMMKPLQFGGGPGSDPDSGESSTGLDGEKPDAASDVVRSFGTEALAKAIANGGGLGLAQQIIRQVTAEHDSNATKVSLTKVSGGRAEESM
jgi:flagellar protein FlgJ